MNLEMRETLARPEEQESEEGRREAMRRKSRYGVLYFQDTSRAQAPIALASKAV